MCVIRGSDGLRAGNGSGRERELTDVRNRHHELKNILRISELPINF